MPRRSSMRSRMRERCLARDALDSLELVRILQDSERRKLYDTFGTDLGGGSTFGDLQPARRREARVRGLEHRHQHLAEPRGWLHFEPQLQPGVWERKLKLAGHCHAP